VLPKKRTKPKKPTNDGQKCGLGKPHAQGQESDDDPQYWKKNKKPKLTFLKSWWISEVNMNLSGLRQGASRVVSSLEQNLFPCFFQLLWHTPVESCLPSQQWLVFLRSHHHHSHSPASLFYFFALWLCWSIKIICDNLFSAQLISHLSSCVT
jgi:hypothetical protein